MTNLEKLRLLGEALHGARWMRAVSRDLGVNERTVLRWNVGDGAPNNGHIAELLAIAESRKVKISEAIACSTVTSPTTAKKSITTALPG